MAVSIRPFSASLVYQRASLAAPAGGADRARGESPAGVSSSEELSEEEKKQVSDLRKRDAEVRAHENAHASAGGAHAGSPSYEMQRGPDGKAYAVGGEVAIDTSAESTPEATARKMDVVIRAALAPADPSPQDQRVAAAARQTRIAAQSEARKQREAEQYGDDDEASAISAVDAVETPGEPSASGGIAGSDDAQSAKQAQYGQQAPDQVSRMVAGERSDDAVKLAARGIFGKSAGGSGNGVPIFAGSGEFVGFNEEGGDSANPSVRPADIRLTASRAYGESDARALLAALGRT